MGIINNQGVFIAPPLGEGEGTSLTSFREDDDFSTEIFDESIVLPSLPNNIGIAFVKSSDSPADYATIALNGTNTSTIFIDNTVGICSCVVSGDFFVGYGQSANLSTIRSSFVDYVPSVNTGDVFINGRIYANQWNFTNVDTITANVGIITTISGVDTITANDGIITTISGVDTITANVGIITTISGITSITPVTKLNVNGSLDISENLNVSGISTFKVASSPNLTVDSSLSFQLTSNTNLRVYARGTDGITRTVNLTLS